MLLLITAISGLLEGMPVPYAPKSAIAACPGPAGPTYWVSTTHAPLIHFHTYCPLVISTSGS